ncbi:MAG: C10 family peptidase [Sedimentisphaerales bacterium]
MRSFVREQGFAAASLALSLLLCSAVTAEPARPDQVRAAADAFLKMRAAQLGAGPRVLSATPEPTATGFREVCDDDGTVLAYIAELEPRGFIAVSTDTAITPIVAYSLRSSFPPEDDGDNPLCRMLKEDMRFRLREAAESTLPRTRENNARWNLFAGGVMEQPARGEFRQWPAENTTVTGGLVETTWHQSTPYNALCPLDPIGGDRCVVGCVATAMAQILNYYQLCDATFDASDGYSTYSGIDIDADSARYDFPSLDQLNAYLVALKLKYSQQAEADDLDAAALSFACGITLTMDYSSKGSGAYLYDARLAILNKFGFRSAELTGGLSSEYLTVLRENIVNGAPAILGLTYPTLGAGHAAVCDGYNTEGEYHLNFGWGRNAPDQITEAWYHLPAEIALAYVDETVVNIQPVPCGLEVSPGSVLIRTSPGVESEPIPVYLKNNTEGPLAVNSVSCPEGFVASLSGDDYSDVAGPVTIERPGRQAVVNVRFRPTQAGSLYGLLSINYGHDRIKYVMLTGVAIDGGTQVEAGEVSGTWTAAESPYYVHGDIRVATDGELVIEPGVRIVFVGPHSLTVGPDARLSAQATATEPIEFTAANKQTGWKGLRFLDSGDDDLLSYCSITLSKKGYESSTQVTSDMRGGAIYCDTSVPTITYCRITNNIGDVAGAIYAQDSDLVISNTLIANNASMGEFPQTGGICGVGESSLQLENCTIVNNFPGAILSSASYIVLANTIVWGNGIYQVDSYESLSEVTFCDVQGGYPGQGNIDLDPRFFDPSGGIGADYDGSAANWALRSDSPCINGGIKLGHEEFDLAGNARLSSSLVDIGAYENQSELPLMTLAPASSIDVGAISVGDETTETLKITNTGALEFTVESIELSEPNNGFYIAGPISNRILTPGESISVDVGFAPTVEKRYSNSLCVHSTSSNGADRMVTLCGMGIIGAFVPPGEVGGMWTKQNSPYVVTGDVEVQRGRSLVIEPGVVVEFTGHYRFRVGFRSTLRAVGTEQEPIVFTAVNTDEGWYGIRFVDTDDDDILQYCRIEYVNKTGYSDNWEDTRGGAIVCGMSFETSSVPSSPLIDHCLIANNTSPYGAGIMCADYSEAVITYNRIVDNVAYLGGGMWIYSEAAPLVANNVIAHNEAVYGGGIYNNYGMPRIINNTIVHNRPSGLDLDWVTDWSVEKPGIVWNNIVWDNEMYVWDMVMEDEYDLRYNDIQGGPKGEEEEGNIDVDPLFADPVNRDYHLRSQAGRWDPTSESWIMDEVTSPCVDAGNPETEVGDEPAPNGSRVNMGAHGRTPRASKSLD